MNSPEHLSPQILPPELKQIGKQKILDFTRFLLDFPVDKSP